MKKFSHAQMLHAVATNVVGWISFDEVGEVPEGAAVQDMYAVVFNGSVVGLHMADAWIVDKHGNALHGPTPMPVRLSVVNPVYCQDMEEYLHE